MKKLALFDFDGTLTTQDSMLQFLMFTKSKFELASAGMALFPQIFRYFFSKKQDGEQVKSQLFARLFVGSSREDLEKLGKQFFDKKMPAILRPAAMQHLEKLKIENYELALVSASLDFWLRPFAAAHGMTLICTEIEYENNIFRGKFATPNCNFEEKARRVQAIFDVKNYEKIVAFGNSSGDQAMLDLADEAFLI